ncbi:MAG: hypothetical protein GY696_33100, partial [Gammaproteobacteria bacterium]|nr:hypothetical protein [Gammaproteobacteria bacterium]
EKTFLSSRVTRKLDLPINFSQILSVLAFQAERPQDIHSDNVSLSLILHDGNEFPLTAYSVKHLTGALHRPGLDDTDMSKICCMSEDAFADKIPKTAESFRPDLLIGLHNFLQLVRTDHTKSLPSGLRLVPSKLGTLIGGSVDDIWYPDTTTGVADVPMCFKTDVILSITAMSLFFKPDPPLDLTPNLEDFWSFETLGIRD